MNIERYDDEVIETLVINLYGEEIEYEMMVIETNQRMTNLKG